MPGQTGRADKPRKKMSLINYVVNGSDRPPIVLVHGFACAHDDWDAQVAYLSRLHQTIAVDLRGHGASVGTAADCSIERYGADVAEVMRKLALPSAVLVGHSMGCRVILEAALQAPTHTGGLVLIDGSQFASSISTALQGFFATSGGYAALVDGWFKDMFTAKTEPAVAARMIERAARLPREIGEKLLIDMVRYDVTRLAASLAALRVPVMAVQTTYSNEKRERKTMSKGETTPYLDMLRAEVASLRVEIIVETGHFPQIDEAVETNELLVSFLATLSDK
jgi:pimeloyl-ACP methyl ester carboxylesterase